jgi:sulfonate transport system ATP-binding protein
MSAIIQAERKFTAGGRPIEPHVDRQSRQQNPGIALRISGLEKKFGSTPVLKGIDLDVPAGQFLAIVGKSGCGKSTLLRLLVGLDQPTAGTIEFALADGSTTAANSRIVFQEPRLLPWASVIENVAVGLGRGAKEPVVRQQALEALAEVQLDEKAGEWPSRLSGGQRQRVALARALVSHPDFLAFDEPLGALDALTRITMQGLVERMWRDEGFTALFVTHDVSEAVALADRVIVLDEGHIALDLDIPFDHPREKGSPELAALERRLLDVIFGR